MTNKKSNTPNRVIIQESNRGRTQDDAVRNSRVPASIDRSSGFAEDRKPTTTVNFTPAPPAPPRPPK